MDDDLITMKAAAAILNVSWQRVQQLAAEGKLDVIGDTKGRSLILFRRADVERLRLEVESDVTGGRRRWRRHSAKMVGIVLLIRSSQRRTSCR